MHNITVNTRISVHMAFVLGVTPVFIWEYIFMGRVFVFTPATKTLMITSSKLIAKDISMPEITKDTIIADILEIAPNAFSLFQSQGMQCLGCCRARNETLEQACSGHGVDVNEMLTQLNALAEN